MGRRTISVLLLAISGLCEGDLWPQQTVDQIVVRIENDIILLSDMQTLKRYQQLVDGKSETDDQVLERLVNQWIVRTEADASRFPHPSDAELTRAMDVLRRSYESDEVFEKRKMDSGLSAEELQETMRLQLYLSDYLESRFRPTVHVSPQAVEEFYEKEIIARAKARGQSPPTLDASRESIQEALLQLGINEQADQWLKESRARLRIEKILEKEVK
jgi:hypothetical protein